MIRTLFIILFIVLIVEAKAQDKSFYAAFWNVENLFDTVDQPENDDSEFLPGSEKQWDQEKFRRKIINLSSVIMSMNSGKGPDMLGLCEVENKAAVESLVVYLRPDYETIHRESPDGRGIDNALIFRKDLFTLLSVSSDTVHLENENTRSILGARFLLNNDDTLSVFVNHWPSRRGGESSEIKRIYAAQTLKNKTDKVKHSDFILMMGDFNDEPENISIDSVLNAGSPASGSEYVNLAAELSLRGEGTYKYRDTWNMLDQIIISHEKMSIKYKQDSFEIYKPYFMITRSGTYAGTPFPTFGGRRYLGGFSDHFPVKAEFLYR
jgi:predicted extracellular nuclease